MKRLLLLLLAPLIAHGQSTINATNSFAYAGNTGWINFRPSATDGVVVGESFLSGYAYAANFGWVHLGDGTPTNGHTYGNSAATDCGVNHDGAGNLSGMGYGANVGWINFGWAGANDPNRPRLDLASGFFSGFAYGANVGWINLGTGTLSTNSISSPDSDGDSIADAWEMQKFGNLTTAGIGTDFDRDGQSDAAEYFADTDPNDAGDYLRVIAQTYDAGFTQVTLQIATTKPSRVYRIQSNTTLQNAGSWADVGAVNPFAPDPGGSTTKTVTFTAAPALFFRAVAQKPLP